METRRIGSLTVSVVGLGCNNFGSRIDATATASVVRAALDAGITFFDTADIYGGTKSEEFLGRALGARRSEVVVATKFGMAVDDRRRGARPEYVRQAAEDSLRRLGTDHIDLYQLHEPDPTVPIADTLGALNDLILAGKVREIGCSNFSGEKLHDARAAARPDQSFFVSVQNEYNLLHRDPEADVIPECVRHGLSFIPYYPLASGLLSGKYRKGQPAPVGSRLAGARHASRLSDHNLAVVERYMQFASARGHNILELAISWLASRPAVASVIAGATNADQVKTNAIASGWRLTEQDLAELDRVVTGPRPVLTGQGVSGDAIFTGDQIAALFDSLEITHVVSVPDSTIGQWYGAIEARGAARLVRVCREGEAWGIAAGLHMGGARPIVMIQCTGLFESGDAIRNVLHDWKLPIFSVIGYRSYLNQDTLPGDTSLVFTEPILDAWRIDYRLITAASQLHEIAEHYRACRLAGKPGAAVIAEGKA